jgi:hypothetical protein
VHSLFGVTLRPAGTHFPIAGKAMSPTHRFRTKRCEGLVYDTEAHRMSYNSLQTHHERGLTYDKQCFGDYVFLIVGRGQRIEGCCQ